VHSLVSTPLFSLDSRLWLGDPQWTNFRCLFAIFAILENTAYTKVLGFQLLYWHYLKSINHPVLKFLDASPQSFVGEDIEISLMLLAYFTATTNISRKTPKVDDAYQTIGVLSQIAKRVRDYKVSRFGGAHKSRTALLYDDQQAAVVKTTTFVRQWIKDTEERGLLRYKKTPTIPNKKAALQDAYWTTQVIRIDLDWEAYGREQLSKHLTALESNSKNATKDFDLKYLKRFRTFYSFNEATLERFHEEMTSQSSFDELPLDSQVWQNTMAVLTDDQSEEAKERERKRRATALAERDQKETFKTAPRRRGRPRKRPPTPPPPIEVSVAAVLQRPLQKKRGRPPGSRNKLKRGGARELPAQEAAKRLRLSTLVPTEVFDAEDDDQHGYGTKLISPVFFSLDSKHGKAPAPKNPTQKRLMRFADLGHP